MGYHKINDFTANMTLTFMGLFQKEKNQIPKREFVRTHAIAKVIFVSPPH